MKEGPEKVNMKPIFSVVCVLALLVLVSPSASGARAAGQQHSTGKPSFSVGLVTGLASTDDSSLNDLVVEGVQRAAAQYGIGVRIVQARAASAYVRDLTAAVQQKSGLTVAVGPAMGSAVYTVATRYPFRKFALVEGSLLTPKGKPIELANVVSLRFQEQEVGFLAGVLAAEMEVKRIGAASHYMIGFLGGAATPTVNRYIAGYIAGALRVAPGIRIVGGYAHSFTNRVKGRTIGLRQIRGGADVLFAVAGTSGLGYLSAARDRHVYGIGSDADEGALGAYILTSTMRNVPGAVRQVVGEAAKGRFIAGDRLFDLKDGGVAMAKPSAHVPASVVQLLTAYTKAIEDGVVVPPETIPRH